MDIITQFKERKDDYEGFRKKLIALIPDLLTSYNIKPHQITSRVKEVSSLEKKTRSKQGKYSNISEITDCVGIRIISYLEDEVDKIASLIEEEFQIDYNNSVDKRKLETDRFGYKSLHFVVSLSKERQKLREYSSFGNLKAEIQIRSILQHSWAEIEHDLGYKSEITVPDIVKRDFFRVAALLETADIEFVKIKNILNDYKEKIESEMDSFPDQFSLDKNTLISYLQRSEINKQIIDSVIEGLNLGVSTSYGEIEYVLETFKKYGINSIEQLDSMIKKYSKEIIEFERASLTRYEGMYASIGGAPSIHTLAAMILLEKDDVDIDAFEEDLSFGEGKIILKKIMKTKKLLPTKNKRH